MQQCALVVLCFTVLFSVESAFAVPLASGVWGKEEWSCGGPPCTRQDIRAGTARRVFEGLRLEVQGSGVCGIWYSYGSKLYRGFLKGRLHGAKYQLSFGPEIDHNPTFYGASSFSVLPAFATESVGHLRVRGLRVIVAWGGQTQEQVLHPLSLQQRKRQGIVEYQPWEREYLAACQREA